MFQTMKITEIREVKTKAQKVYELSNDKGGTFV